MPPPTNPSIHSPTQSLKLLCNIFGNLLTTAPRVCPECAGHCRFRAGRPVRRHGGCRQAPLGCVSGWSSESGFEGSVLLEEVCDCASHIAVLTFTARLPCCLCDAAALAEQTFVVMGAGSAGMGVVGMIAQGEGAIEGGS